LGPVSEPAALEKAPFDPPDEVFDGALLIAGARPAELWGKAVIERDLAEDRIPDDELALARDHHGLGIVPDRDERDPAERLEGVQQPADQRLLPFVRHQDHVDNAAPLEPAREEVDALDRPRAIADVDLAEVVLAELAGHALEPHQRGDDRGSQPAHELVDRALAAAIRLLV